MDEKEWVKSIPDKIQTDLQRKDSSLAIVVGKKLPYAYEVASYNETGRGKSNLIAYETDLLVFEQLTNGDWIPRLIIEAKINSVTTHDAITYSQKAFTHKNVHPYLRYGILIGNRKHYPLPGRLFRHGAYFDFMLSWQSFEPSTTEFSDLINLILEEVEASRNLQEIIFNTRKSDRKRCTLLRRSLILR